MTTTYEPGCYLDSHHGHYNIPEVVRFAQRAGRPVDVVMAALLDSYDDHSHEPNFNGEAIIEESDRAIDWLNEHQAVDGHTWGWNDGDFGLYPDEEE
jgi:hypothetical protein